MDTEYAWAAGFIDADGTITLKRYYRNGRIVYQPYITVAQADNANHLESIEFLKTLFGGSISHHTPKPPRTPVHQWIIASQATVECIKKIRPFLRIKHTQADLLLKYYGELPNRDSYYRISEEEHLRRGELFDDMRLLNFKGKLRLQRLSELASIHGRCNSLNTSYNQKKLVRSGQV